MSHFQVLNLISFLNKPVLIHFQVIENLYMDSSLLVDLLDSVLRCEVLRLPFPFTAYTIVFAKGAYASHLHSNSC